LLKVEHQTVAVEHDKDFPSRGRRASDYRYLAHRTSRAFATTWSCSRRYSRVPSACISRGTKPRTASWFSRVWLTPSAPGALRCDPVRVLVLQVVPPRVHLTRQRLHVRAGQPTPHVPPRGPQPARLHVLGQSTGDKPACAQPRPAPHRQQVARTRTEDDRRSATCREGCGVCRRTYLESCASSTLPSSSSCTATTTGATGSCTPGGATRRACAATSGTRSPQGYGTWRG
jgi:hypothetical protein